MSGQSPPLPTDRVPLPDGQQSVGAPAFKRLLVAPVQFVGFWTAVVLPFVYTPMLASGLSGERATLFVALLVANLLGLVLGRNYKRD